MWEEADGSEAAGGTEVLPAPMQNVLRRPSPPGRHWEGVTEGDAQQKRGQGRLRRGQRGVWAEGEERGFLHPSFVLCVSQDANQEGDVEGSGPKM